MDDISRGQRRDYTKEIISRPAPSKPVEESVSPPTPNPSPKKPRRKTKKLAKAAMFFLLTAIAVGIATGGWLYYQNNRSPVPNSLHKGLNFPVYYPDQKKLPAGYVLNQASFSSPQSGIIVYSINKDSGQKITFSIQAMPEDSVLQNFYKRIIPLRIEYQTPIGLAQIGGYDASKAQTVASLPTKDGVWILATAPANIDQTDLRQTLASLKK